MPNNYYSNIRSDVLAVIPNKPYRKILEIGGGKFPTLLKLNETQQAEIWGVDVYPCAIKDLRFIQGSIESPEITDQLPDNYFDLIIANDVIEHLLNTESFMDLVTKKLTPGGVFVTSVPNIRQLRALFHIFLRGSFPRDDAGLFDKTHLRWFCKNDVIRFANCARLILQDFNGVGRLLPRLLNRTFLAEFLALQFVFVFRKP